MSTQVLDLTALVLSSEPATGFTEYQSGVETIFQVITSVGAEQGRAIRYNTHAKNNSTRAIIGWTSGLADQQLEILVSYRPVDTETLFTARQFGVYLGLDPANPTTIGAHFEVDNTGGWRLYYNANDSTVREIWSTGVTQTIGTLIHFKARIALESGSWHARTKSWTGDRVSAEPAWPANFEVLPSAPFSSGIIGFGHNNRDCIIDIEFLSIATAGDVAPASLISYFDVVAAGSIAVTGAAAIIEVSLESVVATGSMNVAGTAGVDEVDGTVVVEATSNLAMAGIVVVSVETVPFLEDFSAFERDSDPTLTELFAIRSLSASEGSVAEARIRRSYNATGGQVLELFHTRQDSTDYSDANNGVNFFALVEWDDYGLVCFEQRFSIFFKQVPGEAGDEHFAGFGLNRFGTTYYNGGGFVVLIERERIHLRWLGSGGGFSGATVGLSVTDDLVAEIIDGETLVLIVTRGATPGTVYRRDGGGTITTHSQLLPSFSAMLFRERDGLLIGTLAATFNLYNNGFDAQNPGEPDLPLGGECGPCYSIHEGFVHVDYLLVSAQDTWDEPEGAGQLASPVIVAPTFGELATSVSFRQVDRLLDEDVVCLVELIRGITAVELHNGPVVPDADGLRTVALATAGLVQARDYRVRVTTSLVGFLDSTESLSERFTVDRTGETKWTDLAFAEGEVNPAEFPPLYNAARALFFPRSGVPSQTDGAVLQHRSNAGSFGAAVYWVEAAVHLRRVVFSRLRLHTNQSSAGVSLRAVPGVGQWSGYGFYLSLASSGSLAIVQRSGGGLGGNITRDSAVVAFVPGGTYVILGQTDNEELAGKCWRTYGIDDEPEGWQVEYTTSNLVAGLAGLVGMGEAISQGARRREYDSFGVTGLDELPDDLEEPVGAVEALVPPCSREVQISWVLGGERIEDLVDLRLEYEVFESDNWILLEANPPELDYLVWNTSIVSPGQYRIRLVGELDSSLFVVAVSSAFFVVLNAPPLAPTITLLEDRGTTLYAEASAFEDPNLSVGDYHLDSQWILFDRVSGEVLADSGRQDVYLTSYEFLVPVPSGGYRVSVRYWDQCGLSAAGQLTSGGLLWNCGTFECPPTAETPVSSLWTCAPAPPGPLPEEPPVEEPETPIPPEPSLVTTLRLVPTALSLVIGETFQFEATPKDQDGNTLVGRLVTWATTNSSVVQLSAGGLVLGLASGVAQVFAFCEGIAATSTVTVFAPTPLPAEPNLPPSALFSVEEVP